MAQESRALTWLLLAVTAAFALIVWPFNGAVWWAVFLAIVFMPLHRRMLVWMRGKPNLAALSTLTVVLLIVILPLIFIGAALTMELAGFYEKMRTGELAFGVYFQRIVAVLPEWLQQLLQRFGLGNLGALQQKLFTGLAQSGQAITGGVFTLGQNTLDIVVSFFIMLYLLFFLLRDGRRIATRVLQAIPLREAHKRLLANKFGSVVRATLKGNILVALIQGLLGGLAFWVLGITGAVLWGALMAVLSLMPAVGSALVWGPVAIYLFATGSLGAGIGLTLWGVLVIGLVDNVLRPVLVGKDIRMADYLVLISTIGGLAVFGINGFVLGPVIAALFLATWSIFARERAREGEQEDDESV